MSNGDWGSTAAWANASANLQQAQAMQSMDQSIQYQSHLLSQQNNMLNAQQLKMENIVNARRMIIDFETRLPNLTSLAATNPEHTVCLLAQMEIDLSSASTCFEDFEDMQRSTTILESLTQLKDSIRTTFTKEQHKITETLPKIPFEIGEITELIKLKSEAETLNPAISDSNIKIRNRKRFSVIPLILMLIFCPLVYSDSAINLDPLGQVELTKHQIVIYPSNTNISLTNFSELATSVEAYSDVNAGDFIQINSKSADLIRESSTLDAPLDNYLIGSSEEGPFYESGIYMTNMTSCEGCIIWITSIQITSSCTNSNVHCKLVESAIFTDIYVDDSMEITEITHMVVFGESYHVGPVSVDDEFRNAFPLWANDKAYATHVIESSWEDLSIQYDTAVGEYVYEHPYDRSLTSHDERWFARELWLHTGIGSEKSGYRGDITGAVIDSMDQKDVCKSIDFSLYTDKERPISCSEESIMMSVFVGLPFIAIFFFLQGSPRTHRELLARNQTISDFISTSDIGHETIEKLANKRDELMIYYQSYAPR